MIFYCFLVYVCRPRPDARGLLRRRIPALSKETGKRTAAKIVQTESRISSLLEYYAEVQPILCKDSANREQDIKLA